MTEHYIGCQQEEVDKRQQQNRDVTDKRRGWRVEGGGEGDVGCQEETSAHLRLLHKDTTRTVTVIPRCSYTRTSDGHFKVCTMPAERTRSPTCDTEEKHSCQLQLLDKWLFFHSLSDLSCFSNQEALLSSVRGTKQKQERWRHQQV